MKSSRFALISFITLLTAALLFLGGQQLTVASAAPLVGMPDVGDAPDSTNASGKQMTAYPGVIARFPTAFGSIDDGLPQGPKHLNPELYYYLGAGISGEDDADLGTDSDGIYNIIPAADDANNDQFDDGLGLPGQLEHCSRVKVRYIVTLDDSHSFANAYVNLWFDWNRDGSWKNDRSSTCSDGQQIPEWAVQNVQINLVGPDTYVLETPYFRVYNPTPEQEMWVRITLSDQPAPAAPEEPGQGPLGGYGFGETEDYLIPGAVKEPGVDIYTSDNQRFHANILFPEHEIDDVLAPDGNTYRTLLLPAVQAAREAARSSSSSPAQNGQPLIPAINRIIALPADSLTPTLKIGQVSYSPYMTDVIIYPAQPSPIDQGLPDDDADFGDPPFTISPKAYAQDKNYPEEIATLTPLGQYRGLKLMLLSVASGQYNPVDKLFRPFRSVELEVEFQGGAAYFLPQRAFNPFENKSTPLALEAIINEGAVVGHVGPGTITTCVNHEFIIITHPNFRTQADQLAAWKNQRGLSTKVVETGNGANQIGSTKEAIRQYLRDEYDRCTISPSYVLFMGDVSYVPTWTVTMYLNSSDPSEETNIPSDMPYVQYLSWQPNENIFGLPEMAYGRLPVNNTTEAQTAVDKIINYEQNPPKVPNYYSNMTFAGYFQCCWWSQADGTTTRGYIQTTEQIRSYMVGQSYSVERIYASDTDFYDDSSEDNYYSPTRDDTPRFYRDGSALPNAIGPNSGFAWDGSTQDVIDAFDSGRFLIFHRDHGSSSGWGDPAFKTNDVNALSNGSLQPVVYSINCTSGAFDISGKSFAEKLLLQPNAGSVSVLAATRVSPSWENNALARGLFDATWPNFLPSNGPNQSFHRLGDILNYGKLYMFNQQGSPQPGDVSLSGSQIARNFYLYHVVGDPTLELWTEDPNFYPPFNPTFTADPPTTHNWSVFYNANGATMTVLQDGEPLGRTTVANGVAEFEFVTDYDPDKPLEVIVSQDGRLSVKLTTQKLVYLPMMVR